MPHDNTRDRWIFLIAVFKLVKGLLPVMAGIGALQFHSTRMTNCQQRLQLPEVQNRATIAGSGLVCIF
jgi:hypothetical protein